MHASPLYVPHAEQLWSVATPGICYRNMSQTLFDHRVLYTHTVVCKVELFVGMIILHLVASVHGEQVLICRHKANKYFTDFPELKEASIRKLFL